MNLPRPPQKYDAGDQAQMRAEIKQTDKQTLKRGQDIEIDQARLIIRDADGVRWALTVDTSGVLGTEAA